MKLVLVYNPKSGSALTKKELQEKCADANIEIEAFIPIRNGFEKALAPHVRSRKNIAVIGGDGTISAVAGQVAGTGAILVPLPGGTLNHFTKDLDIPQDVDKALARLKKQRVRRVDTALVNKTRFINNSSIGIYPATVREREAIESKVGKWLAAVAASLRAFVRLKTYQVTIDEGKTFKTPFIFIGNNRYTLEQFGAVERSSLDEGLLTVFIAKTQSRLTLLKIAAQAVIGMPAKPVEFDEFHPTTLTVKTKRSTLSVAHDGEVSTLTSPLHYAIEPKNLQILG